MDYQASSNTPAAIERAQGLVYYLRAFTTVLAVLMGLAILALVIAGVSAEESEDRASALLFATGLLFSGALQLTLLLAIASALELLAVRVEHLHRSSV